jgi:hypothetical protein
MKETEKDILARLRYIMTDAIYWYNQHKDEGADYLYDRSYEIFQELPRGVLAEVLRAIAESENLGTH